jgi:hypothetical protein
LFYKRGGAKAARPAPWFKPVAAILNEVTWSDQFIPFQGPQAVRGEAWFSDRLVSFGVYCNNARHNCLVA